MGGEKEKLELIASKNFTAHPELVYIIDFLNKSVKQNHIMFGLVKGKKSDEMTINIYKF